jgi:hypothetical protein
MATRPAPNESIAEKPREPSMNRMTREDMIRDKSGPSMSVTTGGAGQVSKLSTEQRIKIATVIKSQHVQPVTDINFSISIGTYVPRNVGFHPLPAEIVTIYPEWRGYEFFLANNQIVVVQPRTHMILDVIDA